MTNTGTDAFERPKILSHIFDGRAENHGNLPRPRIGLGWWSPDPEIALRSRRGPLAAR
jgi:hypothetical protein